MGNPWLPKEPKLEMRLYDGPATVKGYKMIGSVIDSPFRLVFTFEFTESVNIDNCVVFKDGFPIYSSCFDVSFYGGIGITLSVAVTLNFEIKV